METVRPYFWKFHESLDKEWRRGVDDVEGSGVGSVY
jgi:hypothetical protein